jgi:hypothetical protein
MSTVGKSRGAQTFLAQSKVVTTGHIVHLFYIFNCISYIASDDREKEFDAVHLRHYPSICLGGRMKTTENGSRGQKKKKKQKCYQEPR